MNQRVALQRNWQGLSIGMAVVAALLLAMTLAPGASAEVVESGKTRLRLDRGLFTDLAQEGVKLAKVKQAKVQGRLVTLPVKGGLIEPASASGWVDGAGGFSLRAGKRVARLTELSVNTAKEGLWAKLDGRRMKVAVVKDFEYSRSGFGGTIRVDGPRLNAKAASLLNRRLGLEGVFRAGRALGAVASTFLPGWDQVTGGDLQISFDPGTIARIRSLDVDVIPFEMSVAGSDPLTFHGAVKSGAIDPDMGDTWGAAEGGLRIVKPEAASAEITWSGLGLSFESDRVLSSVFGHTESGQLATVPGGPFGPMDLSGATVEIDPTTRTVTVRNVRATLGSAAEAIDKTFAEPKGKAPVLAASDPLGTISMTLQGR